MAEHYKRVRRRKRHKHRMGSGCVESNCPVCHPNLFYKEELRLLDMEQQIKEQTND